MFIQSMIPEIAELTVLFMNLVTLQQLSHNPTIKTEAAQKGFNLNSRLDDGSEVSNSEQGIPLGFLAYPVSQTADILFCKANVIPVGEDQLPVLEQGNKILRKFNALYGEVFPEIKGMVGDHGRLVGIDGNAKASKSLGNAIMLSDSNEEIERKVMSMYTDSNHLRVEDPGKVEGNVVFNYLDIFDSNTEEVAELKAQYEKGGLGDVVLKKRLVTVLQNFLEPIRARRAQYAQNPEAVMKILLDGTERAREFAQKTMIEVREVMKINYVS
jgi:tryptophanyl-tRNA synthetase